MRSAQVLFRFLITEVTYECLKAFAEALQMFNTFGNYQDMVQEAAHVLSVDNADIMTNFVVKLLTEKADVDLDKHLKVEIEARRKAREEGRPFVATHSTIFFQPGMPDSLRLRYGSATRQQMALYESFAPYERIFHNGFFRMLCGFKSEEIPQPTQSCSSVSSQNITAPPPPELPSKREETEQEFRQKVVIRKVVYLSL